MVITEPQVLGFDMQTQDPLCYNDSTGRIELLISGGTVASLDDYQVWVNDLLREPYIYDLPEGTYEIWVEDLNKCRKENSAVLVHPDSLVLSFDTEDAYCPDKPDGELHLNIDGGIYPYYISWTQGLPDNEQDFTEVGWGEYIATDTDANVCKTTDTVYVDFERETCLVVPNAFSPNGDGFNDLWIIENIEFYPQVDLKIFDRWGNMVYITGNAADEPWDGSLKGRPMPIDSYHYIIDLNYGDNDPILGNVTIVR